ncbi:MAG: sulfurtransferase [Lewinella sp.]|uniref:sulfurtransferase n=1 Tax=Lewinella sp. TaxID=2004506 RepID=UPI003D6B15D5
MFNTIISAAELAPELANPNWLVIDCRHDLADTESGRRAYLEAHIPGARFAHMDEDLSGPIIPGTTGRHPLPCVTVMKQLFGHWGISPTTQVVVYDDKRGAIAARLWWMLRFLGHDAVAVLDGGLASWEKAGLPQNTEVKKLNPVNFVAKAQENWINDAMAVDQLRVTPGAVVIDSRTPERYRGEVEPIDPVAGHVPGAINMPFADNWTSEGLLKSPEELRTRFAALPEAEQTTFYCGSGVTACHNILAYAHAGLGNARLYPGSWSDWITDEGREISVA